MMVGILMLNTIWVTLLYRSQAGRGGIVECADCYDHFYVFSFNYIRVEVFVLLDILFSIFKLPVASLKIQCVSLANQIYCHTEKTLLLVLLFCTTTTIKAVLEVQKM
jgi:hypothetical protein